MVAETRLLDMEPRIAPTENTGEGVEAAAETIVEAALATERRIEVDERHNQKAHNDPLNIISKDKGKRSVGIVEEDIFESTRELAASLARQKREDRWIARAHRAAPMSSVRTSFNERVVAAGRSTYDREEDDADDRKKGRGVDGMGGGKIRVNTGHVGNGQTKGGEGEVSKWAGKDVGMLLIELIGEELVVEGVALKRGRKKRK